jgi:hypothetical protein
MKKSLVVLSVFLMMLISVPSFAEEVVIREGGSHIYHAKVVSITYKSPVLVGYVDYSNDKGGCAGYYQIGKCSNNYYYFSVRKGISSRIPGAKVECRKMENGAPALIVKPDF